MSVTLQVAESNLTGARIIREALDQEPEHGGLTYTFTPLLHDGPNWIEAEVQWPDGRRAYATNAIIATAEITNGPPQLTNPRKTGADFSLFLAGLPQASYVIETSTNLAGWTALMTNTLPASGVIQINDSQTPAFTQRYYRAVKAP